MEGPKILDNTPDGTITEHEIDIITDKDGEVAPEIVFSDNLICDEHIRLVEENNQRLRLQNESLKPGSHHVEEMTPGEVLLTLAKYCENYMDAPISALGDGNFADPNLRLTIESGSVVLRRYAKDSYHLLKNGKPATAEEMRKSSITTNGAPLSGSLHTFGNIKHSEDKFTEYPVCGEFRIPVKDFLDLGRNGKVIIGNLGEAEIDISGDIARKFLTKIFYRDNRTK